MLLCVFDVLVLVLLLLFFELLLSDSGDELLLLFLDLIQTFGDCFVDLCQNLLVSHFVGLKFGVRV